MYYKTIVFGNDAQQQIDTFVKSEDLEVEDGNTIFDWAVKDDKAKIESKLDELINSCKIVIINYKLFEKTEDGKWCDGYINNVDITTDELIVKINVLTEITIFEAHD